MRETYVIAGKEYPVIGRTDSRWHGNVSVIALPLMNDGQWAELARERSVKHYTEAIGHAPESVEAALAWERRRAAV